MPNKQEFLKLMDHVVREFAPLELGIYEASSITLADRLFATGSVNTDKSAGSSEFQFIESATAFLQFLSLMVGTFDGVWRLVDKYRKSKKEIDVDVVLSSWREELEKQGISESTSREVVSRFRSDVVELLQKD